MSAVPRGSDRVCRFRSQTPSSTRKRSKATMPRGGRPTSVSGPYAGQHPSPSAMWPCACQRAGSQRWRSAGRQRNWYMGGVGGTFRGPGGPHPQQDVWVSQTHLWSQWEACTQLPITCRQPGHGDSSGRREKGLGCLSLTHQSCHGPRRTRSRAQACQGAERAWRPQGSRHRCSSGLKPP